MVGEAEARLDRHNGSASLPTSPRRRYGTSVAERPFCDRVSLKDSCHTAGEELHAFDPSYDPIDPFVGATSLASRRAPPRRPNDLGKPSDRNPAPPPKPRGARSAVAGAVVARSRTIRRAHGQDQLDKIDVQITTSAIAWSAAKATADRQRRRLDRIPLPALYDTFQGNASYPELTIGGIANGEREIPNDSAMVRQLDDRVVELLGKEFGHQQVRLQLDRITTVEAGKRFLRISAHGIADFGREGNTSARVDAMYDRRDNTCAADHLRPGLDRQLSSSEATTAR